MLRYIKLLKTDKDKLYTITPAEFKEISIIDITIADLNNITANNIEKYIIFFSINPAINMKSCKFVHSIYILRAL